MGRESILVKRRVDRDADVDTLCRVGFTANAIEYALQIGLYWPCFSRDLTDIGRKQSSHALGPETVGVLAQCRPMNIGVRCGEEGTLGQSRLGYMKFAGPESSVGRAARLP